jgi:hypothetical protein
VRGAPKRSTTRALAFTEQVLGEVAKRFPLLFEDVELGTAGVDFDQSSRTSATSRQAKKAVLVDGSTSSPTGFS